MRSPCVPPLFAAVCLLIALAGCGGDDGPGAPARDVTAPATVDDLAAASATDTSVTLVFTAPGDDGASGRASAYELRHAPYPADPSGWESWSLSGGTPAPRAGGEPDTIVAGGLTADQVYMFRLRAADEVDLRSDPSNVVVATADPLVDTTPPADVDDLAVAVDQYGRVMLSWTAPGDDGVHGRVASYDIRHGDAADFVGDWQNAPLLGHEVFSPGEGGTAEEVAALGLARDTEYFIALVAADDAGNASAISNVVSVTTPSHRTWYVKLDGSGDAPTIRAACVDSADNGDVVLVAPGRYTWTNQGDGDPVKGMLFFPRNDAQGTYTLRSEAGPEQTIIDAEDQARVFFLQGFGDYHLGITIEGFTITGGNAWAPGHADSAGGGLVFHLTSPVIRDCVFSGNRALFGGGIAQAGWGEAQVEDCLFELNEADYGAAVALGNSEPRSTFTDCVFRHNVADVVGGALYAGNATFTCERCLVHDNNAGEKGGGFYCGDVHPSSILACTIAHNSVDLLGLGAGIRVYHNLGGRSLSIERCIVAFNQGSSGIRFDRDAASDGTVAIGCCDIFGNSGGDGLPALATDLGDNFGQDPLFCGAPGSGDYGLQPASPCAPGQHPSGADCGPIGAIGVGCGGIAARRP